MAILTKSQFNLALLIIILSATTLTQAQTLDKPPSQNLNLSIMIKTPKSMGPKRLEPKQRFNAAFQHYHSSVTMPALVTHEPIKHTHSPLLLSKSNFTHKDFKVTIHYRLQLETNQLIPLEVVVDKHTGPESMRHQIILIHSSHYSHQPGDFVGEISKGLFKNQPAQFIIDFRADGSVKNMEQVNWSEPSKHKFIRFNYFEGHTDHLTFNGGENKASMFDYQE